MERVDKELGSRVRDGAKALETNPNPDPNETCGYKGILIPLGVSIPLSVPRGLCK